VERFPNAANVTSVGKYLNPMSKNGGEQWEAHQRMMQASAYMRMMELGFPGMAEGDWEPLHTIEAFLAPPPIAAIAARGDALLRAASGAMGEEKAAFEASPPELLDEHAVEERHMSMNHTKDEQAYQKNKTKVRMITMSWQEYYDQALRGKNDDGSTQEFFPFRKFDVIHVDPPYDWTNHPTPQLMKKFRRLLDACSKEGTIVIIWNHWMQLADYGRMLAGGYNDGILTRWDVDPSLACVIRHKFRTVVGNGGCTMKSMTDHFMTAVRCGDNNKSQKNKMQVRNNPGQTSLLEIKNDVDLVPFPNVIFESLPPNKNQCLRNAKGKPMRPMSERGPALNLQLARRFVPKGGSVFDPFGGTASFGLALMLADHDASYFALDSDEALLEPATARLGRAFRLREKYQQEYAQSLVSLCAFQALASSHNAFVLPNSNLPPCAPSGKPLGLVCQDNLPVDEAGQSGPLEIKPTGLTIDGVDMGDGLFVRNGAGTLKAGLVIPGLHFYGTFIPTSQLGTRYEDGIPGFPGVFLMTKPLEDWCLVLDQRCPGAKINDARGKHAHINIDIYI
jgi:16S rRNA G966 N2-methylase RsmD